LLCLHSRAVGSSVRFFKCEVARLEEASRSAILIDPLSWAKRSSTTACTPSCYGAAIARLRWYCVAGVCIRVLAIIQQRLARDHLLNTERNTSNAGHDAPPQTFPKTFFPKTFPWVNHRNVSLPGFTALPHGTSRKYSRR
jgi:hypothetical protein